MPDSTSGHHRFPTSTHWSLVDLARSKDGVHYRQALTQILERYAPALRSHLVFRHRMTRDRADEMLQGFIAGKVLDDGLIAQADPARGKFRTFLLTALENYVRSELRREGAQKRRPADGPALDIEGFPDLPGRNVPMEHVFDVNWARGVLAEAIERMRSQCERSDRQAVWKVFQKRLLGPILDGSAPVPYEELVAEMGFESPSQASNTLITAKRLFARTLRAVVGEYADGAVINQEILELREILSHSDA